MSYYPEANTRAGRVTGGGSRLRVLQHCCRGQKACLHAQDRSELANGVKIVVKRTVEGGLLLKQPSACWGSDVMSSAANVKNPKSRLIQHIMGVSCGCELKDLLVDVRSTSDS